MIHAFSLEAYDDLAARLPQQVTLAVYFDDIALNGEASTTRALGRQLADATGKMLATIDRDLQALVAEEKVAAVASTRRALRAVSKATRLVGHMAAERGQVRAVPNLGVDYTAGGIRKLGHRSTRGKRRAMMRLRKRKSYDAAARSQARGACTGLRRPGSALRSGTEPACGALEKVSCCPTDARL